MNEKFKAKAIQFKDHVKRNKVAYILGGIAVSAITFYELQQRQMAKFLEEKGIDPMEYFYPEIYEETKELKAIESLLQGLNSSSESGIEEIIVLEEFA